MASNLRQILKALLDAIVFSNIWIALAALSLHLFILDSLQLELDVPAALLIFLGTFIAYNFLKFKGLKDEGNQSVFFEWMRMHKVFLQLAVLFACLFSAYLMFFLEALQYLVLLVSALTVLLYLGVETFNLRRFWFLKTPIVGLVWALILVVFALVSSKEAFYSMNLINSALFVYFFIVGLTIPFELRDFNIDLKAQDSPTLPMKIGKVKTKIIALVHLLLALVFLLQFNQEAYALIILILLAVKKIIAIDIKSSEYEFSFVLDGIIVAIYPSFLLTKYLLFLFAY